jgi:hypothetical protein
VVLAQPIYAAALYAEGRAPEPPAAAAQLLFAVARPGGGLRLVPASPDELAGGRAHLPRESAVLAQLLSPAAIGTYRWGRPPGVLVFGCAAADDDALDRCDAAGLPVSPSMLGPHTDALATQLKVFFKHHRYPDHKAFIL